MGIQNIQNNSCSCRISYFSDPLHIESYKEALMCKISLHLYDLITSWYLLSYGISFFSWVQWKLSNRSTVFPWKYFFFSNCNHSACVFLQKGTIFQYIHPGSHKHCMSSSMSSSMLKLHQIVSSFLKYFFQLALEARVFISYYAVFQGWVFFSNSGNFNFSFL